jgi:hypothetical protein
MFPPRTVTSHRRIRWSVSPGRFGVTSQLKQRFPEMCVVGSGYTYLQDWLPNVGQHYVRTGQVDFVGLGRMVLSYPDLPADVVAGRPLQSKKVCRTFSDCTTGPRNGLISGCFRSIRSTRTTAGGSAATKTEGAIPSRSGSISTLGRR